VICRGEKIVSLPFLRLFEVCDTGLGPPRVVVSGHGALGFVVCGVVSSPGFRGLRDWPRSSVCGVKARGVFGVSAGFQGLQIAGLFSRTCLQSPPPRPPPRLRGWPMYVFLAGEQLSFRVVQLLRNRLRVVPRSVPTFRFPRDCAEPRVHGALAAVDVRGAVVVNADALMSDIPRDTSHGAGVIK
jgi:hypothetical protein